MLLAALQIYDVAVVCLSLLLATLVYSGDISLSLGQVLALRLKLSNFVLFALFLLVCHRLLVRAGLYRSRRLSRRLDESIDVIVGTSLCTVVMVLCSVLLRIELLTSDFIAVFWASSVVILVASRLALRLFLAAVRMRGRNLRHVLIVGSNDRAVRFARALDARPGLGYALLGFADEPWAGIARLEYSGYQLVTGLANLDEYLRTSVVDELVIALPVKSNYERIQAIISTCEEQGIVTRLLSGLFDLKMAHATAESFEGLRGSHLVHQVQVDEGETVLSVHLGRMEGGPVLAKQLLDVIVAGALILALSPVFVITALLVKITSPGPIFFVQERVGMAKRRFRLYKFRTMVLDAESRMAELERLNEVSGPVFKIRNDPRVTVIGRFLRKTSIDELPQFFNVLKRDMSLVGPRPLPIRDFKGFDENWQRRRFSVRPGITCLWQVNGRSDIEFEEWMKLDMQYIDQWSLWLDLKILLKTVPAVFKGLGAA